MAQLIKHHQFDSAPITMVGPTVDVLVNFIHLSLIQLSLGLRGELLSSYFTNL